MKHLLSAVCLLAAALPATAIQDDMKATALLAIERSSGKHKVLASGGSIAGGGDKKVADKYATFLAPEGADLRQQYSHLVYIVDNQLRAEHAFPDAVAGRASDAVEQVERAERDLQILRNRRTVQSKRVDDIDAQIAAAEAAVEALAEGLPDDAKKLRKIREGDRAARAEAVETTKAALSAAEIAVNEASAELEGALEYLVVAKAEADERASDSAKAQAALAEAEKTGDDGAKKKAGDAATAAAKASGEAVTAVSEAEQQVADLKARTADAKTACAAAAAEAGAAVAQLAAFG